MEIKDSFRQYRGETDPSVIQRQLLLAQQGIQQLGAYTNMTMKNGGLEVTMSQNPMPAPAHPSEERITD